MCIEFMRRSDTRAMKWTVTGLTLTFPFESEFFNFVLDKGALDTVKMLINWTQAEEGGELILWSV
jgi:hypothetical protein